MGGAVGGLSITVDVDGEAGLPEGGLGHADRLTSRSERLYGIARGLPRILDALAESGAIGTFYVPGATALAHADAIRAIVEAGHEIGHHGHHHLLTAGLDAAGEHGELADGLAALAEVAHVRPAGYRSPGWELTPVTLALLGEHGFAWDSSLMGDDRPYRIDAGGRTLVELPVHWSLDDAPHFAAGDGDAEALLRRWCAELRLALAEERHVTFTLHPEILGRGHRVDVLRGLLELAGELGVPVLSHGEVARRPAPPPWPGTPGPPR
ncbi:MAG TPA: polysaccharide deacetylase family protein [Solirubrobacteraceae bacterium]